MIKFIFTISFLIIIFLSCSKDRIINIKNQRKELVVNCTFNPDSTWKLWLSSTVVIGEASEYFPTVNNASIQLFQNDTLVGTMLNDSNGYYTLNILPKVGCKYKIAVHAIGFQDTEATDSIPTQKGTIGNGFVEKKLTKKKLPPPYIDDLHEVLPVSFQLNLPSQQTNYFKVQGSILPLDLSQVFQPAIDSGYLSSPFHPFASEDKRTNPLSWEQGIMLFEDNSFQERNSLIQGYFMNFGGQTDASGELMAINPNFIKPQYLNPFYNGNSDSFPMITKGNSLLWKLEYSIQLLTLSETYYKYNKTRLLQQYNRTIPGAEFNNVYSNIKGGKGIFAGYQSHKIILQ